LKALRHRLLLAAVHLHEQAAVLTFRVGDVAGKGGNILLLDLAERFR